MALGITPQPESKSMRIGYKSEDGTQVFSCGATWQERGIGINVDFIDVAYCNAHKEDVEGAITSFLAKLNASLDDDGYPTIHAE